MDEWIPIIQQLGGQALTSGGIGAGALGLFLYWNKQAKLLRDELRTDLERKKADNAELRKRLADTEAEVERLRIQIWGDLQ